MCDVRTVAFAGAIAALLAVVARADVELRVDRAIANGAALGADVAAQLRDAGPLTGPRWLDDLNDARVQLAPDADGPTTRPDAPTVVAFLLRADVDGRPGVRVVVADARRRLRTAEESSTLQHDAAFDAEVCAAAIRRGIEKSREAATSVVLVAPTVVRDVADAAAPAAARVGEWVGSDLLARPGTFLAEWELFRYLAPAPRAAAAPRDDAAAMPGIDWILRGTLALDRESDPKRPPVTLRVSAATLTSGTSRTLVATLPRDALAPARSRGLLRELDLRPEAADAAPKPKPEAIGAAIAAVGRDVAAAGDARAAAALLDRAAFHRPADVSIRRDAVAAYLASVEEADGRPKRDDVLGAADRIGTLSRSLVHLRLVLEAKGTGPRSYKHDPYDNVVIRTVNHLADAIGGEMAAGKRFDDDRDGYRALVRDTYESWIDDWIRRDVHDVGGIARNYIRLLPRESARADFLRWIDAHRDAPGLPAAIREYADRFRDWAAVPGAPDIESFYQQLEGYGIPKLTEVVARQREVPRLQAEANARVKAEWARQAEANAKGLKEYEARQANRPPVTAPADLPTALRFAPFEWRGRDLFAVGDHDFVLHTQKIEAIDAAGRAATLVELAHDDGYFTFARFDGRYLWAPTMRTGDGPVRTALVVVDTQTKRAAQFGPADGMPPIRPTRRGTIGARMAVAPFAVGRAVAVGTADRAWIVTLGVDETLERVDVKWVAQMTNAGDPDVDPELWKDPTTNFEPHDAWPAGVHPRTGLPTHVVIERGRYNGAGPNLPFAYDLRAGRLDILARADKSNLSTFREVGPGLYADEEDDGSLGRLRMMQDYATSGRAEFTPLNASGRESRWHDGAAEVTDPRWLRVDPQGRVTFTQGRLGRPWPVEPPVPGWSTPATTRFYRSARGGLILRVGERAWRVTFENATTANGTTRPAD